MSNELHNLFRLKTDKNNIFDQIKYLYTCYNGWIYWVGLKHSANNKVSADYYNGINKLKYNTVSMFLC